MAEERIIINKSDLISIGNAIREITGSTQKYYPSELASQIVLTQISSLNVSHDNNGNVTLTIK